MYKVTYTLKNFDVQLFRWFKTKEEADAFAKGIGAKRLVGVTKG